MDLDSDNLQRICGVALNRLPRSRLSNVVFSGHLIHQVQRIPSQSSHSLQQLPDRSADRLHLVQESQRIPSNSPASPTEYLPSSYESGDLAALAPPGPDPSILPPSREPYGILTIFV